MFEIGNIERDIEGFWTCFSISLFVGLVLLATYAGYQQPQKSFFPSFKDVSKSAIGGIMISTIFLGSIWGYWSYLDDFRSIQRKGNQVVLIYVFPQKTVSFPISMLQEIRPQITLKRSKEVRLVIYLVSGKRYQSAELPMPTFLKIKSQLDNWKSEAE